VCERRPAAWCIRVSRGRWERDLHRFQVDVILHWEGTRTCATSASRNPGVKMEVQSS
jgi:hypothetical protein